MSFYYLTPDLKTSSLI